ncbi:Asp/Glu racemase [Marivita sp. S6314]|uniref:maleate cis-trans isomerase family protein n=1 Tax=Marivita sp. S6314 TaxID=2926406 RepID=UPI001FF2D54B|nr:Asp/Glu racemase [Marivita sp. S6314]MCK0149311.1 Asp/Glu racemase [Marivita sp. S6314]
MRLSYEFEADRPTQIGMIVLQSDETLEPDFRVLMPPKLEYLVARVASSSVVSSNSLRAMEMRLTEAAQLLPRGAAFSAVGYGCTSASAEIGPDRIAELIKVGVETPHVTEPVSALIAACRHLGVTRLAVISPYVEEVSQKLFAVLVDAGISVPAFSSFEEPVEAKVVRIAQDSVAAAAIEIGRTTSCDAVFLSCTNLRTLRVLRAVEADINKPVLSSNQVLAWHLVRLAGQPLRRAGLGRLLEPC